VALAAVALIPPVAYLGNLGFAPLTALAGLASLPLLMEERRPSIGLALLVGLLAWGLATTAWSPVAPLTPDFRDYDQVEGLTWLKLILQTPLYAAVAFAASRAPPRLARQALLALAAGLAVLVLVLLFEGMTGALIYQWIQSRLGEPHRPDLARRNVARACYPLVLVFWPVALTLWRMRLGWVNILFGVGLLASPIMLGVDAPLAALFVSLGVFVLVRQAGQPGLYICSAGAAAYFAFAPVVVGALGTVAGHKESWGARAEIWRVVLEQISRHPLRGWGLDASRILPEPVSLHPHDMALQIWFELGVAGATIAAVFWAWLFWSLMSVEARDRGLAAAGAAAASAYLTIGALSFGVWQEWWLALGALTAAVFALSNVSSTAYLRKRASYFR
jgi:O-antigen ligase